jgi:hypothetical protein
VEAGSALPVSAVLDLTDGNLKDLELRASLDEWCDPDRSDDVYID